MFHFSPWIIASGKFPEVGQKGQHVGSLMVSSLSGPPRPVVGITTLLLQMGKLPF